MSHHSEREKKSDKSSHKTSKSKGDRRPGSSTKKQPQKPNDFEKTGGESAVVPEIAASELILEKELGTGCFGTVFLGINDFSIYYYLFTHKQHVEENMLLLKNCIHKKWMNMLLQNSSVKLDF
jgi:hypothetical protein